MVDLLQFPRVLNVIVEMVTGYMGKELLIFISNNGNKEELEVQRADIYIEKDKLIIKDLNNHEFIYCINLHNVIDCSINIEEYDIDSFIEMNWGLIHINSFS